MSSNTLMWIESMNPRVLPFLVAMLTLGPLAVDVPALPAEEAALWPEEFPLPYDVSAYELAPFWRAGSRVWNKQDLTSELRRRAQWQKGRKELHVYYYRIGYTLAFPLPLGTRPDANCFPLGIREITYPWFTWLSWEIDERWRTLLAAWEVLGDQEAASILKGELEGLAWENFRGDGNQVGLPTGHFAGALAVALARPERWHRSELTHLEDTARNLLENDLSPWFEKTWANDKPITSPRLHNYVLILFRGAQLARVMKHPLQDRLEARAEDVFRAWCSARTSPVFHSEGTAYDGYLLDAVTEWLAALPVPKRGELLNLGRQPLVDFCRQAMALTLPGRVDLQAPLGDVEPEMTFWATVLARVGRWFELNEVAWLLQRFPPSRLRTPALVELIDWELLFRHDLPSPKEGVEEQLASVTLRTGYEPEDILVAISLPRCQMGHLHADAGHVVIGWHGRFWLTDPGYQQYRPGEERVYTVGPTSHNLPVIAGTAPSRRGGNLLSLSAENGTAQATVDITPAYTGLTQDQKVLRQVVLQVDKDSTRVIVRDNFYGFQAGTPVVYHWLGGAHLAWAFQAGKGRLSDGRRSMWIGCSGGPIEARWLDRHPGSRGPLTLVAPIALDIPSGKIEWSFVLVPSPEWFAPNMIRRQAELGSASD